MVTITEDMSTIWTTIHCRKSTIDNNLKFHIHSASASLTFSTLYKSMVRPHPEYGNTIWGPYYQGDIELVESVQRTATKLMCIER